MKKELGHEAIYDARQLGTPRMLVLGLQHMFAMFGATVLVPILVQSYGLPLSTQTTLFFAALHKRGKRLSCFLAKIPSCFFLSRPVSFAKETNEGGHSHDAVCVQKEIPSCWCFYFYQHRFC